MEASSDFATSSPGGLFIPENIDTSAARLHRLQLLSLRAERDGDLIVAAKCLELAAREQRAAYGGGGSRDGNSMPILTPEEAHKVIAEFLHRYERGKSESGPVCDGRRPGL